MNSERVLIVHNAYTKRGGEDGVVAAEARLLEKHDHTVSIYSRHNDEIRSMSHVALARDTVWSPRTLRDVEALVTTFKPDLIHVYNTFPLISPSLYWAASRANIPVVQTLHNFRLMCPQAMLLRDGHVCEKCVGAIPWRSVVHRCYRDSAVESAVLTVMLGLHRSLGTYRTRIARYIALNEFCRRLFVKAGIPSDRISIKPNLASISTGEGEMPRRGALFVGRLSAEKGTNLLVEIATRRRENPVDVIGIGPEAGRLENLAGINLLGWRESHDVYARMRRAAYVILPSLWYENAPLVIMEAYGNATPVIASRLGAMAELIRDGETGLLFDAGDAGDLERKMAWADANPDAMRRMGEAARREYEGKYTPDVNYRLLMAIYKEAADFVHSRVRAYGA